MNKFLKSLLLGIVASFLVAGSAVAAPVFYDNFNAENGGTWAGNYENFDQWTVSNSATGGSVDLVGGGNWENLALDGLSVDLDGSTGTAGVLTSDAFNVQGGNTYTFSFDIAGNMRGGDDDYFTVLVHISDYYEEFTLSATDAWQTITRDVLIYGPASTTAFIVFNHSGGDNVGAVLDNVSFEAAPVPEPATMMLFGMGLLGLAGITRKRTKA